MENFENSENKNQSLEDLKSLNNTVEQNIESLNNSLNTIEEKKEEVVEKKQNIKKNSVKEVWNNIVSKFEISQKAIDSTSYKSDGKKIVKRFSVFSTLNILNRNSDLFHKTKYTLNTVLKTLYTGEEIKDLMEKTNANSFDNLIQKLEKAIKNPNKGVHINNVADNVVNFMSALNKGETLNIKEKNSNEFVNSQLVKYDNGPSALVSRVSSVYGDNRYYNKVNAYINTLSPLYTKFENEKEADQKIYDVEKYIKDTYNYNFKYDNKTGVNKLTKTIKLTKFNGKMDSCVNMLYSVAKTLKGSNNIDIKMARKLLDKNEYNDFLSKKNALNNHIGVKYTVVDKEQSIKKIFRAHSDTISDVVSTLTTIFMARFAFDHKYFAEIERDLTEQAANKMKYLSFSKDPNEDFWINQLIEERVKLNISQVCASNNITNANELIDIYNNNGTVILKPEQISSINDFVFALQYSENKLANNKELDNLPENTLKVEKKLKNKKKKVKKPVMMSKKPNKFLDKLRQTDEYKKYYKEYLEKYKNLKIDKSNPETKTELQKIKDNSEKNLKDIEKLASKEELDENDKSNLVKTAAANDVVKNIVDALEDEENEDSENKENEENKEIENPNESKEDKNVEENSSDENKDKEKETKDEIINDNESEEGREKSLVLEKKKDLKEIENGKEEDSKSTQEKTSAQEANLNLFNNLNETEKENGEKIENKTEDSSENIENKQEENKDLNTEENQEDLKNENVDEIQQEYPVQLTIDDLIAKEAILKNYVSPVIEIEEQEENNQELKVFKTEKSSNNLTDENIEKKISKYFSKIIHGANGKVGVIGQNLNYRILEKKASKNASLNDSERLEDSQFKKANKIRDAKIDIIIEGLTLKAVEYYKNNKEILPENLTVPKLCNKFVKFELNLSEEKTFTLKDLKNCLAVLITESVNPELKSLNLELYTGKKTYKMYQSEVENLVKGDE